MKINLSREQKVPVGSLSPGDPFLFRDQLLLVVRSVKQDCNIHVNLKEGCIYVLPDEELVEPADVEIVWRMS